jgi:hypothetical protein
MRKPQGKRKLGRNKHRREDKFEIYLRKWNVGFNWIDLAQDSDL